MRRCSSLPDSGEVQLKVMVATPLLAVDALNAAITAEMLIADQKGNLKLPTKIFTVKKETEDVDEETAEEDEEEDNILDAINAIIIQRGKQPFKKFPPKYQKFKGNFKWQCYQQQSSPKNDKWGAHEVQVLQKSGHMQNEC